jgi:glycosyltransferase involved in cell wall biosynthesis
VRVLLLHQNFPAQFLHLAPALVAAGHDVVAVGRRSGPLAQPLLEAGPGRFRWLASGGDVAQELRDPDPARRLLAPWQQGRRVAAALAPLAAEGWRPDVAVAHSFWGDALLLDDVFPGVPLVALLELDLSSPRLTSPNRNAPAAGAGRQLQQWADAIAIRRMAVGLCASRFQRDSHPAWLHPRLRVIHEGVDLEACCPDPLARLRLPGGLALGPESMVLSFAARSLEPLRGLDRLLAVLPALQRRLPGLQVVLAGGRDRGCYSGQPPGDGSWLAHLLRRHGAGLDHSRLHAPGMLSADQLRDLFRISRVHAYLSRPYVPSWSLAEAMACGVPVVAARDAGADELVLDGVTGALVDADDPGALLQALVPLLEQPALAAPLRLGGRRHIAARFDRRRCVAAQIALLEAVAQGQDPPLTP